MNNTIKYLLLVLSILYGICLSGQQTPQHTQFMLNKYTINPAYGGFNKSLAVNGYYRSQWTNVQGTPEEYGINAHMPFYLWKGALGMEITTENLGVEENTAFSLSYNYVQKTKFGFLSSGLSIGLNNKTINGNQIRTPQGNYDNQFDHNDPILPIAGVSSSNLTWNLGLLLTNDFFEIALAFENLANGSYNLDQFRYEPSRNINLFFQPYIWVSDLFEIKPFVFAKSNIDQVQFDFGSLIYYNDIYGGFNIRGINSNSFESIGIIIGTKLSRNYSISYSFDNTLNGLKNATEGTHEVLIQYNLNKLIRIGLPPKVIYNPRNL